MTVLELKPKLDKFGTLLQDFGVSNSNSKALWQIKKEIAEYIKAIQFSSGEEKQEIVDAFEEYSKELKKKQDEIDVAHTAFAENAESLLSELESIVGDGFYSKNPDKEAINDLKIVMEKAFDFFKQSHWPSKERRTIAWERYSTLRSNLKKEEDDYYLAIREKKNEWVNRSLSHVEEMNILIDACHPVVQLSDLMGYFEKGTSYLIDAGFPEDEVALLVPNKEETGKPLKVKSESLRNIRKFLNDNKDNITREDKHKLYLRIDIINTELNKAWDEYRGELHKKQEEWEERKKQQEMKRVEWEIKQKDFLRVLEEKLEKRLLDKTALEKVIANKKEYLERLLSRVSGQKEFLKKCKEDLADLDEKLSTAWSDNFKEKMTEKVEYKKSKIATVSEDIVDLNNKLKEVEEGIVEVTQKLQSVEKNIEEIKKKKEEVIKALNLELVESQEQVVA